MGISCSYNQQTLVLFSRHTVYITGSRVRGLSELVTLGTRSWSRCTACVFLIKCWKSMKIKIWLFLRVLFIVWFTSSLVVYLLYYQLEESDLSQCIIHCTFNAWYIKICWTKTFCDNLAKFHVKLIRTRLDILKWSEYL